MMLFMEKNAAHNQIGGSLSGGVGEHDDEKPPPPNRPRPTTTDLPSLDELTSLFRSSNLERSPTRSSSPPSTHHNHHSQQHSHNHQHHQQHHHRHMPKVQSNLLKSSETESSSSHHERGQRATNSMSTTTAASKLSRDELVEWVGERERQLTSAKSEYEKHFDTYKQLTCKFYTERLNNLKLTFKNQILKQKIYFETECQELCREYWADFEQQQQHMNKNSTTTTTTTTTANGKKTTKTHGSKNKHLIKMLNNDLKTLVEYMRESLIHSSDTLIEAYETCECLKRLANTEASVDRQYAALMHSTKILLKKKSTNTTASSSRSERNGDNNEEGEEEAAAAADEDEDEQARIEKYKSDLDELMNTLDDIELSHLQRKEAHGGQCKLVAKLKSKFKFIENKYETLSRQVAALKFESYVFKELWAERQRASAAAAAAAEHDDMLAAPSTSSASRSTSTSSLVDDCVAAANGGGNIEVEEMTTTRVVDEFSSSTSSTSSTSSSSSSSSMMSNNDEHLLLNMDEFELFDTTSNSSDDDSSSDLPDISNENGRLGNSNDETKPSCSSSSSSSSSDYNRKLALITDLISLHKSKSSRSINASGSGGEIWGGVNPPSSSSSSSSSNGCGELDEVVTQTAALGLARMQRRPMNRRHASSSLGLVECSYEGDRIGVENCDLKRDCDLAGWVVERMVDGVGETAECILPAGSVVKSGKVLRLDEPFGRRAHRHVEELLTAIKITDPNGHTHSSSSSARRLTITTRLLAPDRTLMASHTQEIPHFYHEIFKYANLIRFL